MDVTLKPLETFETCDGWFTVYWIENKLWPQDRGDFITVKKDALGWIIQNAWLPDPMQKKGMMSAAYIYLNAQSIMKTGRPLRSTRLKHLREGEETISLSGFGQKLWESLVRKRYAQKTAFKQYEFIIH